MTPSETKLKECVVQLRTKPYRNEMWRNSAGPPGWATLVVLGWQPWSSWVGIAGCSGRATLVVPGGHLSHALRPPDPFQVSLAQLSNNPKIISRTAAPNSIMLQKLGQCRSLGYSQLFQLSHNRCSPISRTSASHWQKFSLISVGWYKKQSCVGMRASQYEATLKCRGQ